MLYGYFKVYPFYSSSHGTKLRPFRYLSEALRAYPILVLFAFTLQDELSTALILKYDEDEDHAHYS